ncbi:hypothetical protein jhhlp_008194 [Lomentospora prolificans]|uniref:F-box domain-containing protein n=1 Tax=Lomentospora prolificans TaxID=41688 RepID=A0A2N3MZU3_9PEZI|nr:hypothetical protein jhhlp_008194 [Lomentospora prolificans]
MGRSIPVYFEDLCRGYSANAPRPLQLKSLHFGDGVMPFDIESLRMLTDLTMLEAVHIDNSELILDNHEILFWGGGNSDICWDAFGPNHAPNLRQLRWDCCVEEVRDFLCGQWSGRGSQLALSFTDRGTRDGGIDAMLRQVWTISPRMMELEMESRPSNPEAIIPGEPYRDDEDWEMLAAEPMLELVVTHGRKTLEGLNMTVDWSNNEDAEVFKHWTPFLEAIGRLPALRQLQINGGCYCSTVEKRRLMRRTAVKIATAAHGLRYIGLSGCYWQVARQAGRAVSLHELDEWEVRQVELFQFAFFPDLGANPF